MFWGKIDIFWGGMVIFGVIFGKNVVKALIFGNLIFCEKASKIVATQSFHYLLLHCPTKLNFFS
jgi:hypothetical protein